MRLLFHFAVTTFSNTYLLGPEAGGDAILVDPAAMDIQLLKLIETNNYYVRAILITHTREDHFHGVKTLLKIYDARTYWMREKVYDCSCRIVRGGERIELCGMPVDVMEVAEPGRDSLAFRIDDLVFTGDVLTAGRVGPTPDRHSRAALAAWINQHLLSLDGRLPLFPAYGPPSTVEAERATNPLFKLFKN